MRFGVYIRTACALVAALYIAAAAAGCGDKGGKGDSVTPADGYFRVDTTGFKDDEVRFYRYEVRGKSVVFLVARTALGEIHTAFDACITCYPHRMGYRCEASRVVCAYCGTSFSLDELGTGKGNCVPIKIKHVLDGKTVLIEQSAIESGAKWF